MNRNVIWICATLAFCCMSLTANAQMDKNIDKLVFTENNKKIDFFCNVINNEIEFIHKKFSYQGKEVDFSFSSFNLTENRNRKYRFFYLYDNEDNIVGLKVEHKKFAFTLKMIIRENFIYSVACEDGSEKNSNKFLEDMVSGFFIFDRSTNMNYFFGTKRTLFHLDSLQLRDIYCVMSLDSNLYPTHKLQFVDNKIAYRTDYVYNKAGIAKEVVYALINQEKEECIDFNMSNLYLHGVNLIFNNIDYCNVMFKAMVEPDVSEKNSLKPLWLENGYTYK